jgi:tetratricopeptide (TPR) repeat protein
MKQFHIDINDHKITKSVIRINGTDLKRHLFLLVFIIISFLSCHSKKDIDEINDALLKKSEALRLKGKDTELIALNNDIIRQTKENGYKKGEALAYINLANMYATMGKYKVSHYYLKSAENIINQLNDNFLYARLYHEYGQMNFVTGLTNTALSYNAKAIYYGKKLKEKGWLLGNMYEQRADFLLSSDKDSALIYYHKGLNVDPSALNSAQLGRYHLLQTKNMDSATLYTSKALSLLKDSESGTVRQGVVYSFYADLLAEKKEYEKALEFYKKAADILVNTKRINKLPELYQQIAVTYEKVSNKEMADQYSLKAKQLDKALKQSGNEAIDLSLSDVVKQKSKDNINLMVIGASIFTLGIFAFLYLKRRKHKEENKDFQIPDAETSQKKEKISKEDFAELLDLARKNDLKFLKRFEEINPSLFQNVLKISPQLTKSELSLCAMIWLGFSSKDIADFTFIQHRSVQTKKGRLRKKLNVSSDRDLYSFFMSL